MSDTVAKACFDAMTRCSTEEIWVAGTFGAFSLAAMSQADKIAQTLKNPSDTKIVFSLWILVTVYSVLLVWNRHNGYYRYWKDFVEIVKKCADEPGMKELLHERGDAHEDRGIRLLTYSPPSFHVWSFYGVGYYVLLILSLSILTGLSVASRLNN